jgi:tRNA threonylcarbamoyladenosine biosynthesis protein TsaE
MFQTEIKDLSALQDTAKQLLNHFPEDRIFAFYGAMGAGKTTFIKALCHELGSQDYVTSPTFALINEYSTNEGAVIYHFDFYRIKKLEEAYDLGYEDYIYSGNYCFIEWPEMIETLLPKGIVEVKIREAENGERQLEAKIVGRPESEVHRK